MKLVIIGAGFGGLQLARKLRNKAGFDITLIDPGMIDDDIPTMMPIIRSQGNII